MKHQLFTTLSFVSAAFSAPASILPRQSNHVDYVVSAAEQQWCNQYGFMFQCSYASTHYQEATFEAIRRYGAAGLANGPSDAFRVCYWNARMQNDYRFKLEGRSDAAAQIATKHIETSDSTPEEKKMDLYAAETGRSWGNSYSANLNNIQSLLQQGCVMALNHPYYPLITLA